VLLDAAFHLTAPKSSLREELEGLPEEVALLPLVRSQEKARVLPLWVWLPSLRASSPPRWVQLGQSAPEWGNTEVVPPGG
jgi:hypothetical protein